MTSTDLMNVAAFRGIAPAGAFAALDPHSESLADGIGSSYGIIGYKGKVWTLRLRGETYTFTRADDGSPAAFLDVIVLRSPPYKSKSFYTPGSYQDGQVGTRPLCAALDGVVPDGDILAPQSTACAVCPRNVFKVNAEGRKTRDCSDYKRLSVLILPSLSKALLGAPLMEPVFLRVPAASLNDLALLGEGMAAQGFHYSSFITRIGFNPEKPHPQMTFRALQALTDREAPVVLPLREDPTAIRITGENEVGKPRPAIAAPAPAVATPPDQAIAAAAAQQAIAAVAEQQRLAAVAAAQVEQKRLADAAAAAALTVDTGFGGLTGAVAQPTVPQVALQQVVPAKPADAVVDIGFGIETGPSPSPVVHASQMGPVASDTGEPEDADLDLDARVAALLPK